MSAENKLYRKPAVQVPTVKKLQESSNKLGFDLDEDQLEEYRDLMKGFIAPYTLTDSLVAPVPDVKYPRTPGYQPQGEENKYNAWSRKVLIQGAEKGLLYGKKVVVKDTLTVAGVPMRIGSNLLEGYTPEFDATVVTRVLDAGAIIVGKSNTPNLCDGGHSYTSASGPVTNPFDETKTPGGSSSGSAVLLLTKEADMSIGNDMLGSVLIPSSCCGTVGMKPTFGLVPLTGNITMEPTLDHLGPMARSVEDIALLLEVIAGRDGLDARQTENIVDCSYSKELTADMKGIKVGILKEGFEGCDPTISQIVKDAIAKLEVIGACVNEVSVPLHKQAPAVLVPMCFEGLWHNMILGEGAGVGMRRFYPTSLSTQLRRGLKEAADVSDIYKLRMLWGDHMQQTYGNKFYQKAQNLVPVFQKAYNEVLNENSVLVMPTIPRTTPNQPTEDATFKELVQGIRLSANTCPFNLTGHPSLTLNAGLADGLPVGVMLVAKWHDEQTLINVAYALEQSLLKK